MNQATGVLGRSSGGVRKGSSDYARMRFRPLRTAALLAAVLVLAGCGGDGEPGPTGAPTTPPPTATATPTPETPTSGPEPTPWPEPARPAAMERDDIEGAKAAAEYFLALYPYVYATGDLEAWQEMSHPECEFCAGTSEDATEIQQRGGFAEVGAFIVADVEALAPDDEYEHFRIEFSGTEEASTLYSADGTIELTTPGGAGSYHVAVVRAGDHWVIREALGESDER